LIDTLGETPLPKYIKRQTEPDDRKSVSKRFLLSNVGAVAAPTAGMHFTRQLDEAHWKLLAPI
jgi:S-adenosylmethionine:tRNA ribosyltransferase-isomerase